MNEKENHDIRRQLELLTVRIENITKSGQVGTGTGFYFQALVNDDGSNVPAIITNKHVVQDSSVLSFCINIKPDSSGLLFRSVEMPAADTLVVMHPDPEIDVCAIMIKSAFDVVRQEGHQELITSVTPPFVADEELSNSLSPLEDVVMIGYPNGIWDSVNNRPIMRRGVTATNPSLDYKGRPEFMIDMACYPGSSGSPVFLFNLGGYYSQDGTYMMGKSRVSLLGLLYAGPQYVANGRIAVVQIPTQNVPIPRTSIPNNLGCVVKARTILEIEELIAASAFSKLAQ